MKKLRRLCGLFLCLMLVISISSTSYAVGPNLATPAELSVATSSTFSVLSSVVPFSVSNTDVDIYGSVYNRSSGAWVRNVRGVYSGMSGSYAIYTFPKLSDTSEYYHGVMYSFSDDDLPDPGTYGFDYQFVEANVPLSPTGGYVSFWSSDKNVDGSSNYGNVTTSLTGNIFKGTGNVTFGYAESNILECYITWPEYLTQFDIAVPSSPISFRFKANADSPSVSSPDVGASGGASNVIANVTTNISNSVSSIDDSIKELIQTIIYQLEALWNQFAGVFTSMFSAWETHTQQIVQAIQNITTAAQEGIENIIDAGHEDTETITDGYDNSSMESENDRLSGSLTELEESEDQLFDQAQSYIDQFEFQDPFTQFTAPLSDLSYWLVGIYSNLGSMNIPISFGFTLSIALLLIGWYRFKGGI
ncbi:hypothetical protein [Lachnoclostridium sp. An14]|uniref:hypothetical protein n=1 Tax=Lachnoclostridium sp. An14 TaxID=1965562 RepID=UPI00117B4B6B|nr:hypothetical protein [Lachnoclostridium sp. An14]